MILDAWPPHLLPQSGQRTRKCHDTTTRGTTSRPYPVSESQYPSLTRVRNEYPSCMDKSLDSMTLAEWRARESQLTDRSVPGPIPSAPNHTSTEQAPCGPQGCRPCSGERGEGGNSHTFMVWRLHGDFTPSWCGASMAISCTPSWRQGTFMVSFVVAFMADRWLIIIQTIASCHPHGGH